MGGGGGVGKEGNDLELATNLGMGDVYYHSLKISMIISAGSSKLIRDPHRALGTKNNISITYHMVSTWISSVPSSTHTDGASP